MYDVIIVGAGPAGLTAALYLGRACRKVGIFDNDQPRNAASHGVHGFISRDGILPAELRAISRAQLATYPNVEVHAATVVAAARVDEGFEITLENGTRHRSRKLILATGLKDELSPVEGFSRFWSKGVFLCPYCDGWEVRGQPMVVHSRGEIAYKITRLLTSWTQNITLCSDGPAELDESQRKELALAGIQIIEEKLARLEGADSLERIIFADGTQLECKAIFTRSAQQQPGELAQQLGCKIDQDNFIPSNEAGSTGIPGLYAVGDARTLAQQVVLAAAAGAGAATLINQELVTEMFKKLVEAV